MAFLIIAELPNWRKQLKLFLGLIVLLAWGWLATYQVAEYGERPAQTWTIARLAQAIESDQVRRLMTVSDREFAETTDGARVLILKEVNEPAINLLRKLNVSEERLGRLEITVAAAGQIQLVEWLSALLCAVPVVILLLKLITGVHLRRALRQRAG